MISYKKKRIFNFFYILLLVFLLIFISGQEGCQKAKETSVETKAIIMGSVEDAPPNQMVTGKPYAIYLNIENVGGFDVPPGNAYFFISGIGNNLLNVQPYVVNSLFLNKKTSITSGGKERLVFATNAIPPERGLPSQFTFPIRFDSCYQYVTVVQTNICVGKGDGICSLNGNKIVAGSNSAGPIQVTSLTETIVGDKLYVTFQIANVGNGSVYLPTTDCVKLQQQDLNEKLKRDKVAVRIKAPEGFSCTFMNNQKGLSGDFDIRTLTCEKVISEASSYTAPFEITLSYIYSESLTRQLTILPAS